MHHLTHSLSRPSEFSIVPGQLLQIDSQLCALLVALFAAAELALQPCRAQASKTLFGILLHRSSEIGLVATSLRDDVRVDLVA